MFVGMFGYFILKEKFTKFDVGGLVLVFLGVVLISNPFDDDNDDLIYPH